MTADVVVGLTLIAGLVIFLIGAGGWRLAYDQPLAVALPVIHSDRRRRAWIHVWMLVAMFVTAGGVAGVAAVLSDTAAAVIGSVAALVYAMGALCWVLALTFRLTVVPWAAQLTLENGEPPAVFPPLDRWAASLYVMHMASAYATFVVLGAAVLVTNGPAWFGWLGVGGGTAFLAGFVATRFDGVFNPPFWAHTYTAALGILMLRT